MTLSYGESLSPTTPVVRGAHVVVMGPAVARAADNTAGPLSRAELRAGSEAPSLPFPSSGWCSTGSSGRTSALAFSGDNG